MTGFRRPAWWAIALTAAAALLFVRLGIWQLHRAAFKESLLRRYAASVTAPVQAFLKVADPPPADSFPRVRLSGHYLPARRYLLDNPHHDERGGIEVFAPFAVDGSTHLLLVDLGFLAARSGSSPPLPPLSAAPTTLQGSYVPPPPTGLEMGGNALKRQSRWPKNSIFIDLKEVSVDLHQPLYPRVLALPADPALPYVRVHKLDFAQMPPSRHRAYAFQWFSFAIAVVVILLMVNRKRPPRKTATRSDSDGL